MMKKTLILVVAMAMLVFAAPALVQADVKMGIAVNDQGLNSFYLALGDYNRVPQQEVAVVRQQGVQAEELPVVFFLAAQAKVPYAEIVKLRLKHWGWMKIARRYKIDPAVFYVPVKGEVKGKVYGRAYGYYSGRPQHKWNKIELKDEDVVNFVNLKFVSEHYGYDPDEVLKMREGGKNFVTINNDINIERTRIIEKDHKKPFWEKKKFDKKHSGRYDYQHQEVEDKDNGRGNDNRGHR
jgi:hypothetical protein